MEALAAVVLVVAAAGAIWVLAAIGRDPDRWPWLFRSRTWVRVLAWTVALTAAAVLGAVLGGSSELVAAAVVAGACVVYAALHFWADSYPGKS